MNITHKLLLRMRFFSQLKQSGGLESETVFVALRLAGS